MPMPHREAWDATESATLPAVCTPSCRTELVPWSEWQLVQNRYSALRSVVFEDRGDSVRLGGCVPSYYLKQVALAAACGLAGSRPIISEIEVVGPPARRTAPTAPASARPADGHGSPGMTRWNPAAARRDPM